MKWLKQSRHISPDDLVALENALTVFYKKPPEDYHSKAIEANADWNKVDMVFHRRIINHTFPGARVLDVGCGPAMVCPHFLERGSFYTGIDLSAEQLELNKSRFPGGEFIRMHWRDIIRLDAVYDLVVSFFVLEHIVHPREFLRMSSFCVKPGGLLCVQCPHYLALGQMPSLYFFGRKAGGIRIKVRHRDWIEAFIEIANRYAAFPIFIRRARSAAKRDGAWVINLRPACLDTGVWDRDWDAVYMASEDEISNYLESMGFVIVERGASIRTASRNETLPCHCYVVGRKR